MTTVLTARTTCCSRSSQARTGHRGAAAAGSPDDAGGPLPPHRLSRGRRCVSESTFAVSRRQAVSPATTSRCSKTGSRLSKLIWKGMALALLPTIQPEAVFIPDTDFTAIKLRDSIEKWKAKKKYQHLQASLFISSPFGTSACIIMVRLKCYISFSIIILCYRKLQHSRPRLGTHMGRSRTPRPTPAAGMRGAGHTDCLPAKSRDGAGWMLRPQGRRLVHGPGLMSRRPPRAPVETLLGTQEHRTRGPACILDHVCAVHEAEGHLLRIMHLKIQRKLQLQK